MRSGRKVRMVPRTLADAKGPVGFVFAVRVLPTVIFVAALFAVLYHLGVIQTSLMVTPGGRQSPWMLLRWK